MLSFMFGVIFFIFVWTLIFKVILKANDKVIKEQEDAILRKYLKRCPPHPWNYEKTELGDEIMICKACRKRPGSLWDDYDKPY